MPKPQGTPSRFSVGQQVRYLPGTGVYGCEDLTEPDGRVPAVVTGHTPQRVRIRTLTARVIETAVDAASLKLAP